MIKMNLFTATALASLLLALSPAEAAGGAARAWVSGHGTDAAGCGAPTNPCRTFQYVHDNIIAAGGEIDVLDPAGYGAVTITKAVSIVNDGVGVAGVQAASSGGYGVVINGGPNDVISLRGLTIEGAGLGAEGVKFVGGASLTIENCVVRHFTEAGIDFAPAGSNLSRLVVSKSTSSDNADGIAIDPQGSGAAEATVLDSVAANNSNVGFFSATTGASATMTVIRSAAVNSSGGTGLSAFGSGATLRVGQSTVTGNVAGWTTTSGGVLASYGDNYIDGNGGNEAAPPSVARK